MSTKLLAGGIVVQYPDNLRLRESVDETAHGLRAVPKDIGGEENPVLNTVVASSEYTTVAVLEITGAVEKSRLHAMEDKDSKEEVTIRLPLGDDESAVLLAECDGVVRWEYPDAIEEVAAAAGGGGLGAAPTKPQRVAVFRSRYRPVVDKDKKPASLGFVGDFLLKPVKNLILRFTARKAAEAVSEFLERNVAEEPILFTKGVDGKVTSSPVASFSDAWQANGNRTMLLFVHGTFSSTDGSFGGLQATATGSEFLSKALDRYDVVAGYDHKTLTRSVVDNARHLLTALETLPPAEVTFDAVAFSRGGLVLRYLTETLLPASSRRFRLRNAVFVGCTNGGTKLADPEHWKDLVDLYTNLVSGAGRVASFAGGPATQLASRIVTGALRGVLSFVRYLASETMTGEAIPGLASMDPEGRDVTRINRRQEGQPEPDEVGYHVVEANFDHKLFGESRLEDLGLKKRLFLEFADGFIDQLFQQAENDLVVDRVSMSRIDPWATSDWIKGRHEIKKDDGVYHTVYFNNEQVAREIGSWLL